MTRINAGRAFANSTFKTIDVGLADVRLDTEPGDHITFLSGLASGDAAAIAALTFDTNLAAGTIIVLSTSDHAFTLETHLAVVAVFDDDADIGREAATGRIAGARSGTVCIG